MIVTYNKEISIECSRGTYARDSLGTYHVRLFDNNNKLLASFDGVLYMSKFDTTSGSLELIEWSSTDACNIAFIREDGTPARGPAIDTFLRGNKPFNHNLLLTSKHFGSKLPTSGTEGQLFFKLVE